ncbi:ATP-binding cassette, subfamily B [Nitrosomonas eutropha]|uniref:ABC transporter ATP-binding protein n=1 Tax=Nitrosomonas TaxID=914 RepID=UPI00089B794B|nr:MULTISPECIES: ABC transporter ATP-binding protein [Nitrosomonas]MXS81303.1 ABC transporter ATP-binding protein [Nitrosomonas sp. GH22]SDW58277.1 ATP-binding cassette, subfamily B [Nitrosomonas eutropha]
MNETHSSPHAPALPGEPIPFLLHFFRHYSGWCALVVLLEIGSSASGILTPYAIGQIVGGVTDAINVREQIFAAVAFPLGLYIMLNLSEVLFSRASASCRIVVAPRLRAQVTSELYAYLQHHSHRFLSNNFAGALASRISETSTSVNMTLWTLVFDFLPIVVTLTVSVALLWYASIPLALFTLVWALLFLSISYQLARRCRPLAHKSAEARSITIGKVVDAVTNLASVRLFAMLGFERDYLKNFLNNEITAARRWLWSNERILWFQYSLALILKVGTLLFALWLWQRNQISVADFVMSISLSLLIINEVRNISRRFIDLFEYIGNITNGVYTIVREHEITDPLGAKPLQVTQGCIELRDVTFSYVPGSPVFENLNLRIEGGQRVGLVGYSGSGKSTLLNLILRLYDPQQGSILIDGQDIRNITQQSLHAQISLIPQDPGLFHRTLLENIRYGRPDANQEEIELAARGADAHEFIERMPSQYESLVGERGVKLSGGQRQRISIARVIVKNAPILIMDEATSSLDSVTEQAIQNSLATLMQNKTVIVVAHRLSTIAHLDRILVFRHGRIIEDGSHAELLAANGAYTQLWTRQTNGFLVE